MDREVYINYIHSIKQDKAKKPYTHPNCFYLINGLERLYIFNKVYSVAIERSEFFFK